MLCNLNQFILCIEHNFKIPAGPIAPVAPAEPVSQLGPGATAIRPHTAA